MQMAIVTATIAAAGVRFDPATVAVDVCGERVSISLPDQQPYTVCQNPRPPHLLRCKCNVCSSFATTDTSPMTSVDLIYAGHIAICCVCGGRDSRCERYTTGFGTAQTAF